MIRSLFGIVLVAALAGVPTAGGEPGGSATNRVTEPRGTSAQVIAYYFHGTVRCVECLKIERQAKELIERQFKAEVAAKRLLFKPVNYDQPENAHFLTDYRLPCPSLVLVRQKGGKQEKWKPLGETWRHADSLAKFNEYVEREVREMLEDTK